MKTDIDQSNRTDSRNKPMNVQPNNLQQNIQDYKKVKEQSLKNGAGKTGQPHAKNETRLLCYTIHKSQLKMD